MGPHQHCLRLISSDQDCGRSRSSTNVYPAPLLYRPECRGPGCVGPGEHCWGWLRVQRLHHPLWYHPATDCPHQANTTGEIGLINSFTFQWWLQRRGEIARLQSKKKIGGQSCVHCPQLVLKCFNQRDKGLGSLSSHAVM